MAGDGVSLDILNGELFVLMGLSERGKTIFLRMSAGFPIPNKEDA